ncbi:MAG: hypothetical protein MZV49_06150 [Rhodopseudomonas palustris]|nr:hypothetical protein [Rhodopseudomonas palustris]
MLVSKGRFDAYMRLLKENYAAGNLDGVMCRSLRQRGLAAATCTTATSTSSSACAVAGDRGRHLARPADDGPGRRIDP